MGEQVIKQVIVALFPTVDGAQQGRQLLEAEKKAISLVNTAVIHMTADGKVDVKENTGLSARLQAPTFRTTNSRCWASRSRPVHRPSSPRSTSRYCPKSKPS